MMGTYGGYDQLVQLFGEEQDWIPIVYFWMYTLLMLVVFLNLAIAILSDAWSAAKEDKDQIKEYPMLVRQQRSAALSSSSFSMFALN